MQAETQSNARSGALRRSASLWLAGTALGLSAPLAAETAASTGSTSADAEVARITGSASTDAGSDPAALRSEATSESSSTDETPTVSTVSTVVPPLVSVVSAQGSTASPSAPPPTDAKLVVSQFVDVPVSGSAASTARYSGRADAYINLRGSSWGADDSWNVTVRPEFSWGKSSNGAVGLIPGNTALFRPEGAEDYDLSLSITKTWSSGASLMFGKINVLDVSGALPIVGSNGHFGFQNLGLALPPTAVVPNTMTGAILQIPTEKWIYRVWVFDPDSQYGRTGFETAFKSGVGVMGAAARRTKIGGKPGIINLALVGSTRSGPAVDILPRALTPPPGSNFGNEKGEFAVQLSAYQYIALYPEAPGKGWGILARFQASSGDPTFLDYSGYIGISGNPRKRPQDRFGLAYFHYSLTDELADDIAFRLPIEDEQGVEAFYTFGVAKGWEVTANVQVVDSAVAFRDTGVTLGMRVSTTL